MREHETTRGRGCLFYGLLTVGLIFAGVMAGVYFGTRQAVRYAIESYTTNAPVSIPVLAIGQAQQRSIFNALVAQFEAAANQRGPEALSLGEEELNVLIAQSAVLRPFQQHVYLQPQGGEIKAFISLPLDQFKPWQEFSQKMGGTNFAGRYLNGIAYVSLIVTNDQLKVTPRKMVVSAKTLPEEFIQQFPWDTLTQSANDHADFRAALQRVESLETADGKVRVKFRR